MHWLTDLFSPVGARAYAAEGQADLAPALGTMEYIELRNKKRALQGMLASWPYGLVSDLKDRHGLHVACWN
jgi:hypothetical protein